MTRMRHMVSLRTYLFIDSSFTESIYGLVDGSLVSDCPLPCKTTQTKTKFLNKYKTEKNHIAISFSSKVKLTKTDLLKPTISSFLSEVGWNNFGNHVSTSSGGRLSWPLAWSGSRASVPALCELPSCGHPQIQG